MRSLFLRAIVTIGILLTVGAAVFAQSKWQKQDGSLKIYRAPGNNYISVEGSWVLVTKDEKNQISYPTAVRISCTRSEGTCEEIYASVESGRLKVDSSEYRISKWTGSEIGADGTNEGLCDIGHRLVIDFRSNSVTITDYSKHVQTNDLCKAYQQPDMYSLQGGSFFLSPAPEWKLGRLSPQ